MRYLSHLSLELPPRLAQLTLFLLRIFALNNNLQFSFYFSCAFFLFYFLLFVAYEIFTLGKFVAAA